jgi:hypothetical protein
MLTGPAYHLESAIPVGPGSAVLGHRHFNSRG